MDNRYNLEQALSYLLINNNNFKEKAKEEIVFLYQDHQIQMSLKNLVMHSINNVLELQIKINLLVIKVRIHNNEN
jgi:hypothetical protein